jgi:hypothetical protein
MAKFAFDQVRFPSSSATTFFRNVTTVQPDGSSIAANKPRFGTPVLVPSIVTPADVFTSPTGTDGHLLASGVDGDGSTELMVWLRLMGGSTADILYTFVGGSVPSTLPPGSPHPRR